MEELRIEALRLAASKAEHSSEIIALADSFFEFMRRGDTSSQCHQSHAENEQPEDIGRMS